MSEFEKQLGLRLNQTPAFVGAKRISLHPRGRQPAVPFNLINGTHKGSTP